MENHQAMRNHLEELNRMSRMMTIARSKAIDAMRYPMPIDNRCNKGHLLTQVFNERLNAYIWDCPICINRIGE
jgi:hypothetical protein